MLPPALENLITELGKLPGVGPRTAERLAFYMLRAGAADSQALAQALNDVHSAIRSCAICHHLSEEPNCTICLDARRDKTVLAIVEEPLDVVAIEKTGMYRGLYHVLGGVILPIDGIGPEQLNINSLLKRLKGSEIAEIILATNPSTEGEATALYIQKQLPAANKRIKITRLARGLPMGSDLEYADQVTLGRALEGRQLL